MRTVGRAGVTGSLAIGASLGTRLHRYVVFRVTRLLLLGLPLLGDHQHAGEGERQRHDDETTEFPSLHKCIPYVRERQLSAGDRNCLLDASDGNVPKNERTFC